MTLKSDLLGILYFISQSGWITNINYYNDKNIPQ